MALLWRAVQSTVYNPTGINIQDHHDQIGIAHSYADNEIRHQDSHAFCNTDAECNINQGDSNDILQDGCHYHISDDGIQISDCY